MTFQAPDNLTAYRLMAVAADAGERFGSGDKRMTVRKPLQLLSAMPRFLNVGDDAKGGVLVVNDTGKAGTVTVDTTVSGARLRGGAHQEIAVPANGRVPVLFPLRAERAGELKLRVKAVLGAETDGLELKLPIHYPSRVETELVAEGHTSSAVEIPVKLPAGIMPASASLEVSTDPDGVAGLEEGLRDLIEYPYGCLEQTTSRLIPLVAVEELARSLKLTGLDGPALQRFIRAGIGKLEKFQTDDGGFSLWMGGQVGAVPDRVRALGPEARVRRGPQAAAGMIDRGASYLRAAAGARRDRRRRRAQRAGRDGEPRLRGPRAGDAAEAGPRIRQQAAREEGASCLASAGVPGARAGAEPGRAASRGDRAAR